jgi:hypothetical protein
MSPCPSSARGLQDVSICVSLSYQGVYSRKLAIVLQLILELGELRNNVLALGLLLGVFSLANCLVQVIDGTCLMQLLERDR